MTDIMIVDDQEIVRDGLKMILSLYEEIHVIGEAENGEQLLRLLESRQPDCVLMDIRMPVMDGIEATKAVKERYPGVNVIILTTFDEDEYIFGGLKYGASGYILKDSSSKEIIKSIKAACDGNLLLNPQVSSRVVQALHAVNTATAEEQTVEQKLADFLTPREIEVAKLIMEGKTNKAISSDLYLTEGTVKNYVSHILDKLELNSRTELVVYLQNK
ncbi:response regulator transcription factor [Paenibacillus caui]|uniref:response regulator transcription factor n=1 Tax=Paenibacillus caui TaxID=2873927 RepID=UPI001CA8F5C2|nr:response regulator transcription factor [Paenibacillus caui]